MSTPTTDEIKAITHWRNQNHQMLRENYRKQFIACGISELLAAGTDGDRVEAIAKATGKPFILDWIPALTAKVNFYWVKFYGLNNKKAWNPLYPVTLATSVKQKEMYMTVDSGAEVSLVSREIGDLLGFTVSLGEELETGEGVGGEIEYVTRSLDLTIDGHTFKAPVAWILTANTNAPLLLGREVVFDLFDIKFVQAEERIEFEWRGEKDANQTAT
jgi:Aspartyl protease